MPKKTVFLGQPLRTPEEQVSMGATICVLTHAGMRKKHNISGDRGNPQRLETRLTRSQSNCQGDHKKLAENVFNLAISSGEILRNLTPDR